jgi:hypothetical protein
LVNLGIKSADDRKMLLSRFFFFQQAPTLWFAAVYCTKGSHLKIFKDLLSTSNWAKILQST